MVTWPGYWSLIGWEWSHDPDTGLWLAENDYMTEQTMLAVLVCTGLGRSVSRYLTISALKRKNTLEEEAWHGFKKVSKKLPLLIDQRKFNAQHPWSEYLDTHLTTVCCCSCSCLLSLMPRRSAEIFCMQRFTPSPVLADTAYVSSPLSWNKETIITITIIIKVILKQGDNYYYQHYHQSCPYMTVSFTWANLWCLSDLITRSTHTHTHRQTH